MRAKIVAGNWKMNLNKTESLQLVSEITKGIQEISLNNKRVMVFPPFVNLPYVLDSENRNSNLEVGSQNIHQATNGAYTGEVAAGMLTNIGVKTTLIGHSERREYFRETPEILKTKVETALENNMEVLFCFGEKLADREQNNHFNVVEAQLEESLFHLPETAWKNIVFAYEPVWAIGTGMTATPDQAQEMHTFIRNLVAKKYNTQIADDLSILYGGSVKPDNAQEIFGKADVDGGLIGGASLKASDFLAIVKAL